MLACRCVNAIEFCFDRRMSSEYEIDKNDYENEIKSREAYY